MKDKCVIVGVIIVLAAFGFMIHDAKADSQQIMERFNRVQLLYDAGVQQYDKGSKFQGCYIIRQAIRESRWIGDDYQTYNQLIDLGKERCNSITSEKRG